MRIVREITICSVLLIGSLYFSPKVFAATYYIDATGGNDNNSGTTTATPWKTLNKVNSTIFSPGDVVSLKQGQIWYEQLTPLSSGSSGNPITFTSYGTGAKPIISGSDSTNTANFMRIHTIYISTKHDITISGIQFEHAKTSTDGGVYINASDHILLSNITVVNNQGFAGIYIEGNGANTVQDSSVSNTKHDTPDRGDGIIIDASSGPNSIIGNSIFGNHASGIRVTFLSPANNTLVSANQIYANGAAGISLNSGASSNILEKNTVYSNVQSEPDYYNVDLFKVGNNNVVRYNTVHDSHFVSLDSGGIRFDGDPGGVFGSGNQISYNVIYNERTGIHLLGAQGGQVYNNVVYNSSLYGINVHGSTANSNVVKNNIIENASANLMRNDDAANSVFDYNLYYPNTQSAFSFNGNVSDFAGWQINSHGDTNAYTADPLFSNVQALDFHLTFSSPAVNTGMMVGLHLDKDLQPVPIGSFVDIGAYEFQGSVRAGDSNGDNKIDGLDYVAWLSHYGQSITGASNGDFNGNGKVDGLDYVIWLSNYGH